MDTSAAQARFEAALDTQLMLAGGDPALESAARTLMSSLAPATRQLALELAEQAAAEVGAQLPGHQVELVLREGEPFLAVRPREGEPRSIEEDYEARITLRLPPSLKTVVEEAAESAGDSINSYVVKTLSRLSRAERPGRRVTGKIRT